MQVFIVRKIADLLKTSSKSSIITNCLTPGLCHSEFGRDYGTFQQLSLNLLRFLVARTTEQGSRTLLAGAEAGEETNGQYMADCHVSR